MRDILAGTPMIPVITLERAEDAVPLASALVDGGLRVLEVTLRTDAAGESIRRIIAEVEGAIVGTGTVSTPRQIQLSIDLGCQFMISPGTTRQLLDAAAQSALNFMPGIATVSEMMLCMEYGYQDFKFFPAESSGGVAKIKAIAGPFTSARFCPTGGIDLNNISNYLNQPNVLCVGGSWVTPAALIAAKRWHEITRLARETVDYCSRLRAVQL